MLMTVAIDAIGIGIIIPVMPDLILEVGGGSIADAAVWGGTLAAVFSVMQLICSPTVGNLSDRYGRRPVLLVSLLFMSVDYIVMGIAHVMWLLFLGRLVGGITASTPSTVAAFIADISKPEEKAQNFGLVGAAFGIGFILGPLFGAFFAEFGTRAPFFAAAAISFANMALGFFVLPETVTDTIRRKFEWKRANPIGGLYYLGRLPGMPILLAVYLLYQVAMAVYPAIWSFYGVERFGWDPRMIGLSLAIYGLMMAIVQGWVIRHVLKWFSERQAILIGMVFEIFGLIGYGFIKDQWMAFALIPICALGAVSLPALQGIMSRTVHINQQGELQGLCASINSFAYVISPLAMTMIFYVFVGANTPIYLPGAPFILSALLAISAMIMVSVGTSEGRRG